MPYIEVKLAKGIKKTGENSYRKIRRGYHKCTGKDSSRAYGIHFF